MNREEMSTTVPYRPLGLIKELLENNGFAITHCYEDLIFVEHNAFLLQMGEKGEEVRLVFNADCHGNARKEIERTLIPAGGTKGLQITAKGTYSVTPNEQDSTISIAFTG